MFAFLACVSAFEPKLCISCKHFLTGPHYGKCRLFPHLIERETLEFDYQYASTARTFPDMCGNGKLHQKIYLFPDSM
jgi:hypothetical protein